VDRIFGPRMFVALDSGKAVSFDTRKFNEWRLGYAATVHKSQSKSIGEKRVLHCKHMGSREQQVSLTRMCGLPWNCRDILRRCAGLGKLRCRHSDVDLRGCSALDEARERTEFPGQISVARKARGATPASRGHCAPAFL
jgi:hypothetical protein